MTDTETKPDPLDHDRDGKKGGSVSRAAAAQPVWVVVKGVGLHQVPLSDVDAAIGEGKGRRATERDLEIAGIHPDER